MQSLDLLVFDLAGTTVKDDGIVQHAFEQTVAEAGFSVEPDWIRARMGWSKRVVFEGVLELHGRPLDGARVLVADFQSHLLSVYGDGPVAPTDGASDAIEALEHRGVKVAFSTGFPRAIAQVILDRLGWSSYPNVASDEVERGRPAPDLIVEAMVRAGVSEVGRTGAAGDTPSDLSAASNAGCVVAAGLGCGTHTLEELAAAPHTHLAPGPLALVEALVEEGIIR